MASAGAKGAPTLISTTPPSKPPSALMKLSNSMIEVGVRPLIGPICVEKSLWPPHLVPAGSVLHPLASSPGLKSGAYILPTDGPPRFETVIRWNWANAWFGFTVASFSDGVKRPSAEDDSKFSITNGGVLDNCVVVGALNFTILLPVPLVSSPPPDVSRACTM